MPVIHLPFDILVPKYVIVPNDIQLKPGRILPKTIKLLEGSIPSPTELAPENIPTQSLMAQENPYRIPAVDVRIFPQIIGYGDQYVEFQAPDEYKPDLLLGHCMLPTNTLPHGPVEDWEFQKSFANTNRVRLLIPQALYHEYIYPYYLMDFWQGLFVHLKYYLDLSNWWATY